MPMPSPAALAFGIAQTRAKKLASLARDLRLRPLSREDARLYLHIALAIYVAGWEGYVERLVGAFFTETIDPLSTTFLNVHTLLSGLANKATEKFHTPSWQNSRNMLAEHTGYDPINDWTWAQRGMPGPQVRERLNEILKVRHSFAHGFSMPAYGWNTSATGEVRLTLHAIQETEAFIANLVSQTDTGMRQHIQVSYNRTLIW
jgi:hypothetical protein